VALDEAPSSSVRRAPVLVAFHDGRARFAYTRRLATAEHRLATNLLASARSVLESGIGGVSAHSVLELLDGAARDVARVLFDKRVSVVTGGPGTGKTTAVAHVVGALASAASVADESLHIAIAAPTAKAALRIRDLIDRSLSAATTSSKVVIDDRSGSVHRLLGLRPDAQHSTRDIDADLVVVDEVSMLELPLLDELISRCHERTRVILLGDPNQLASVNVGAALHDIVEAGDGPLASVMTHLTNNYRSNLALQQLASAINDGDHGRLRSALRDSPDAIVFDDQVDAALDEARAHTDDLEASIRRGDREGLAALERFVVLCATRQGARSVAWWSSKLAPVDALTRPGTPVIVTRNEQPGDSGTGSELHNGDVGVTSCDVEGTVVFAPDSEPRRRSLSTLDALELAYALTIHKSQGSEYDRVVVSLPTYDSDLLTRELLYTAVTRAKERVRLIADEDTLSRCLSRRIARVSGLSERVAALAAVSVSAE
jgi:exodeoxyribonuclease V alpha subunit